jgi:hypothetical protein
VDLRADHQLLDGGGVAGLEEGLAVGALPHVPEPAQDRVRLLDELLVLPVEDHPLVAVEVCQDEVPHPAGPRGERGAVDAGLVAVLVVVLEHVDVLVRCPIAEHRLRAAPVRGDE